MSESHKDREILHGTCVAIDEKAVLLVGASGSGKSATAIQMLGLGAKLVSDDQVVLRRSGAEISASCPEGFTGQIEARGIGILKVAAKTEAVVSLIVDLDQTELQRLPPSRKREILGAEIDLIYGRDNWHLAAGIVAMLSGAKVH